MDMCNKTKNITSEYFATALIMQVFRCKSCFFPFEGEGELADIKILGQMYVCEEAQCKTQLDVATKICSQGVGN